MPNLDDIKNKAADLVNQAGNLKDVAEDAAATVVGKAEELTGKDLDGNSIVGDGSNVKDKAQEAVNAAKDKAEGLKNAAESKIGKDLDGDGKIG